MELFNLPPDQLNLLCILIAKDYSTRYNADELNVLGDFLIALGSNIVVYSASFSYFDNLRAQSNNSINNSNNINNILILYIIYYYSPKNIFISSSTFVIPPIPKFSTKTLATFGDKNAGNVGPK